MTTTPSKHHAWLIKLIIVLGGTLFMSSSAFACKWYDAPCKVRHEAAKLAKKIKAAEAAAARAVQLAADAAAKAAADQAAALAAAAEAEANAIHAALVNERRQQLGALKSTYLQAAAYSTDQYNRIQNEASPFVTPFVNLVNGCMSEISAEPAGLLAQADLDVENGWVNQDFQDATEARDQCASSAQAAAQDLSRRGQKLAGPEIKFIASTIKAAGPCVAKPELCIVNALDAFYDDVIKGLIKDGAQLAKPVFQPITNKVTGVLNGAGSETEAMYRVIREIPTGTISAQGKRDLYAVIKFLGLQNSKGTAGIFFSAMATEGSGIAYYITIAFDLNQAMPAEPKFFVSAVPMVGVDSSVKLGFFWSPYSGTDVANNSIGYPIPIPLTEFGVPPEFTGMFYPQWLMPAMTLDPVKDLNNIKNTLMKSPTYMAGFMFNENTGMVPTSFPVAPLKTRLVN